MATTKGIILRFTEEELQEIEIAKAMFDVRTNAEAIKMLISLGKIERRFFLFDSKTNNQEIKKMIKKMEIKWL